MGPVITLVEDVPLGTDLRIGLTIRRDDEVVFEGSTGTAMIHRDLRGLVSYLGRYDDFPHGAFLMTGTGIVPPDDLALADGDQVVIDIERIGVLRNAARQM